MPNSLAYLMLLIWPVVMIVMFRRMPASRALIWSLLGAYLFLPPIPAAFDFPLLPPFNKDTIPNLMALMICLAMYGRGILRMPDSKIGKILIVMFIVGPIITALTNAEPILFRGAIPLPGLRLSDAFSLMINQAMLLFPVMLARHFLATREAHRELLFILMVAGLIYTIPMLLEIRLSPQLNLWVYGFSQHSFAQSMRGGGFRPVVFLNHGLWVAFFAMTSTIAALVLWRVDRTQRRTMYLLAAGYLGVVLVLCKSLGALLFAVILAPLVMFFGRRVQINIAFALVMFVLAYPVLKVTDLVPTQILLSQAGKISADREGSLWFRFYNEDLLLERANIKPVFGWGSWGRNHLHDPVTGDIKSVTDGRWIIVFGVFGWIGFIAEFGLLTLPIILLWRTSRVLPPGQHSPYVGPLVLLLAFNVLDLVPNATLTPLTWLLSGALLGYAELQKRNLSKTSRPKAGWQPIM